MEVSEQYFGNTISRDLFDMVCGDRIGDGVGRQVYIYDPDPEWVLKFETPACSFQNVKEWDVWCAVEHTKLAKWFAPVRRISSNGSIIMQRRTSPMRPDEYPTKVPWFFTDMKRENWGQIDGQPVCHDYGLHLMLEKGMANRLVKADWWSLED